MTDRYVQARKIDGRAVLDEHYGFYIIRDLKGGTAAIVASRRADSEELVGKILAALNAAS